MTKTKKQAIKYKKKFEKSYPNLVCQIINDTKKFGKNNSMSYNFRFRYRKGKYKRKK